jgi:hypothetical protein
MPRYGNDRDRDERGRFTEDHDRGHDRERYASRDYDYRSYRGNDRPRDENGRFMSDDDHRGNGGGRDSRGRFTSDNEYGRNDRNYGRGYGDHSYGDRGSGRYVEDDDRYLGNGRNGLGRYGDDDGRGYEGGRERDHYGYYGRDYVNHDRRSYSSRYDDDDDRGSFYRANDYNDDRGGRGRGWFDDSEGHSRAARSRGLSDGVPSHGSAHGRGGNHGGWFGDSRGHAEASRRGWQSRR